MEFLNDHECEAVSGGASSLVLPSIALNVATPLNLGFALGLLDGSATVLQGASSSTSNVLGALLTGMRLF